MEKENFLFSLQKRSKRNGKREKKRALRTQKRSSFGATLLITIFILMSLENLSEVLLRSGFRPVVLKRKPLLWKALV